MPLVPYIDISEHQGDNPDLAKAKALGVAGVYIRLWSGFRADLRWRAYAANAVACGLPWGPYAYLEPWSGKTAEAQATAFCDLIDAATNLGLAPTLTAMLDCEATDGAPSNPSDADRIWFREWRDRFANIVDARYGRHARLVYTGTWWWNPHDGSGEDGSDVVVSGYPTRIPPPYDATQWEAFAYGHAPRGPLVPAGWDTWDAWQFSSAGVAPAYGLHSTGLDLNLAKPEAWARWLGQPVVLGPGAGVVLGTQPTPAPVVVAPAPPPTPAPSAPQEDPETMANRIGPFFVQATGANGYPAGTVYMTDGRLIELRRIETPARLDAARYQLKTAGYDAAAVDAAPTPADDVEAYGHVVNP